MKSPYPLVLGVLGLLVCPAAGTAADPARLRLTADLALAGTLSEAACRAERNGSADCVDLYYQAAVAAYACLAADPGAPATATAAYNAAVGRCLRAATTHRRIDPRSHLTVRTPAGTTAVPIAHTGFVWTPAEFSSLIDPAGVKRHEEFARHHARDGVGAVEVVVRDPQSVPTDKFFLPKWQSFAATAVLRPDLDAWLGATPGRVPRDSLEFVDPVRVETVDLAGRPRRLAADFDAPVSQMQLLGDELGYRKGNFMTPAKFAGVAGVYHLEPYQPGKVPLVLVHGTGSGMTTWCDLVNDLRLCPWFVKNFQVWFFTYPSGAPFLRSAHILRTSLNEVRAAVDPGAADPALGEMVLVGHSQGGMVMKPVVCWSGDKVADALLRVPFCRLTLTAEDREALSGLLFFEPQRHVKRVVYIATPFAGVTPPLAAAARLGHLVIEESPEGRDLWDHLRAGNRFAVRPPYRRLPTSADLFKRHQPLNEAMRELSVNPAVASHCIVGRGEVLPAVSPSDRVVPVRSARAGEAESTLYVNETHTRIHHAPATVAEVQRILLVHLAGLGRD